METKQIHRMGMDLTEATHKSCTATFGVGDNWVTIYHIESSEPNKGHATELLTEARKHFVGKTMGSSVALNNTMRHLLRKLKIPEYK